MVNNLIVKIIAERILNCGENPLKKRQFKIEDVTNLEYRKAVEDYLNKHQEELLR